MLWTLLYLFGAYAFLSASLMFARMVHSHRTGKSRLTPAQLWIVIFITFGCLCGLVNTLMKLWSGN